MLSTHKYYVTTFYQFEPIIDVNSLTDRLNGMAESLNLTGLVILGKEGINSTLSARSAQELAAFKDWMNSQLKSPPVYKDSYSDRELFRIFKVKHRPEIVTLGTPEIVPTDLNSPTHMSPEEWHRTLSDDSDYILIDTRNTYETKIGSFKGALDPQIEQFTDFPDAVEEKLKVPKDKRILIFCTGGIRCEKGLLELKRRGYNDVHQLHGGILSYLQKFPNQKFEGECFVFDHRVAVNQNLEPSTRYKLCPHCGQTAGNKITCSRCDTEMSICDDCIQLDWKKETCSKNCRHHYSLRPNQKGARQLPVYLRSRSGESSRQSK